MGDHHSVIVPTNLGSSSRSAGGGALMLHVGGTMQHDGLIAANGEYRDHHTGAGGSVYLTAGALAGGGLIRANGGELPDGYAVAPGGGGRVAVVVTNESADFSNCTGKIEALGFYKSATVASASGRLYLQMS